MINEWRITKDIAWGGRDLIEGIISEFLWRDQRTMKEPQTDGLEYYKLYSRRETCGIRKRGT